MDNILSVRELTERLRQVVEQRFPYAWVRGEVTNLSRPSSGHVYFSLKEGDALLGCVWFAGRQKTHERFDPLTGEVWEGGPKPSLAHSLENGQEIVCAGRLSVYGPRGAYQMLVDLAQETGRGRWYLAFEELKRSLAAQGFFDQSRKRPIPDSPRRVALITAPTGAAVRVESWGMNGMVTAEGTIDSVSDTPTSGDDYYGSSNPNASYYSAMIAVDASAELQEGDYVTVYFGDSGQTDGSALYLEAMYVRTEGTRAYVYKRGEDGLLKKTYVSTGEQVWGYVRILSGLTEEDYIAFPYGKNVKDGAKTVEDEGESGYYSPGNAGIYY